MNGIATIFKNSVANYGKMIYRSGTALVTIAIIARYLNPNNFGKYAFVVALAEVISVFASMGMPSIIVREVARDKGKTPMLLTAGIILELALSVLAMVIMVVVFNLVSSSREVIWGAYICGIGMILDIWGKFFAAFSQGYEKMEHNTYQTLIGQSVHVILVILAAVGDFGLLGIFTALLLARLAAASFGCWIVFKKFARPEPSIKGSSLTFLLREAYPVGIKRILRKIDLRIDTLLLAAMKTKYEVGLFHAVYKIAQSLMFVTESVADAIFPVFSKLSVSSRSSLDLAYEKSFKFVLLIGIPLAIFFSCFSKPTVILILGREYVEASAVLQIFGWVIALMFLNFFMEKMLISGNKQSLVATFSAIILGVNILLDVALIPRFSYVGAAIATLVSEIVLFLLSFHFVSRYISSFELSKVLVKPLVAGLGTLCLTIAFSDLNVVLGGGLIILLYLAILLAVRTFTPEEVNVLRQVLRRRWQA
jgi:O-antigen/teichoic acid export membrane protein